MRNKLSNKKSNRRPPAYALLNTSVCTSTALLLLALTPLTQALPFGSGPNPTQTTTGTTPQKLAAPPDPSTGERTFLINTPIGPLTVTVNHNGTIPPTSLTPFSQTANFRPPSIFSAPLPTGSGARALGVSGSFTAIADDATAASWNPAGLINLEHPELSAAGRHTTVKNKHHSTNPDFQVNNDRYQSSGLNYASGVYPLYIAKTQRALVLSLSYQEAYDFTQTFHARIKDHHTENTQRSNRQTDHQTQTDTFDFENGRFQLNLISDFSTTSTSSIKQRIQTDTTADLTFKQQGIIEAISPAIALEITPQLSFGITANFYQDSALPGKNIQSRTHTKYTTISQSHYTRTTTQTTQGRFTLNGNIHSDGIPPAIPPSDLPLPTITGDYPTFSDSKTTSGSNTYITQGSIEERDNFDHLDGANATLGLLYTANRFLTLGATLDLPWTARAQQTKTRQSQSTTYNADQTRIISQTSTRDTQQQNIQFNFPLFASAAALWRWNQHLYTGLDIAYTDWSTFSFQTPDQGKTNPLDGTPHQQNKINDTYAIRLGTEYLWITPKHQIPLRAGLIYEQRPAIGQPDTYYGFSLGSGISFGKEGRRIIFDIAYSYLQANNIQTIIPNQTSLTTDTQQHQLFLSAIAHF